MNFEAKTLDDLRTFCKTLRKQYSSGIFLLRGDLGVGKTALVKEFAFLLGIKNVSSPTFSIMHDYDAKIYHYDMYRKMSEDFFDMGLAQLLEKPIYHFVEWASEELMDFLLQVGLSYVLIDFTIKNNTRILQCTHS